jgi:hypothetical protein
LKVLVALIGCATAFGAVAYGAARQVPGVSSSVARPGPKHPGKRQVGRPPKPRLTESPDRIETSTTARFAFVGRGSNPRFECRLDGGGWKACHPPVDLAGLAPGGHTFSVRAFNRRGRRGRPARFRWTLLEPKQFSIAPRLSGLGMLHPGAPPVALPLVVANPNSVPIFITSLRVSVTADPTGCASAENLALGQSSASSAAPIEVPAGGSVAVPSAGASAPTIQLLDLPVNQDACQNVRFPLRFSGSARG